MTVTGQVISTLAVVIGGAEALTLIAILVLMYLSDADENPTGAGAYVALAFYVAPVAAIVGAAAGAIFSWLHIW